MVTPTFSLVAAASVSVLGTYALRRTHRPIRTLREELMHGLSAPGHWILNKLRRQNRIEA